MALQCNVITQREHGDSYHLHSESIIVKGSFNQAFYRDCFINVTDNEAQGLQPCMSC